MDGPGAGETDRDRLPAGVGERSASIEPPRPWSGRPTGGRPTGGCRDVGERCILAGMFHDESFRIEHNPPRLSYGVAATDFDGDGLPEFIVTGFGTVNVVLDRQEDGKLRDVAPANIADPHRRAIGVAAADVNADGVEELYILNTDTFMGMKRFGDRFFVPSDSGLDGYGHDRWIDLFELPVNMENPNLHAGRSVAAVDVNGTGRYAMFVANYGGPMRLHRVDDHNGVHDIAEDLGIRLVTGGRSLCIVPGFSDHSAILCGNENDANALFIRADGDQQYEEHAGALGLADRDQSARGLTVCDADNDGLLDIVMAGWEGPTRLFVRRDPGTPLSPFIDRAPSSFLEPTRNRNVIAADFDNDGYTELFFNNIGEPNRLFRVFPDHVVELDVGDAAEPDGLGTGAAVADIDGDGVLEMLVVHGESGRQPLSLYTARRAGENNHIRVTPLTAYGAPARGAVVHVYSGDHHHVRVVDGGSGYLCQMEGTAHFGLGKRRGVDAVEVVWPGGQRRRIDRPRINQKLEVTP